MKDDRSPDEMAAKFAPGAEVIEFSRVKRTRAEMPEELPRNALTFKRMGDLIVREPDWLVRDFIESDGLALLIGDPGTGKSFCALDIAACIATGTTWHGHKVKAGPVLYIAGEGQSGLARRRMAWETAHSIDLSLAPLFVSTVATSLTDEPARVWLLAEIEHFAAEHGHPVLVVLDTLARNFGPGDENATADMNTAVLACDAIRRATGAAVLIAHHSSHADKGRGRGSTVLHAAADSEFLLTRNEDGTVCLASTKMKDAPFPAPMAFCFESIDLGLIDSEGEPITSAVLMPTTYTPPTKSNAGTGKNQTRALGILRDRLVRNRANAAASGRDPDGARVAMEEWRDLCGAVGIDRSRFREVSRSLQTLGLVVIANGFADLCETCETSAKRSVSHGPGACETCEPPNRGFALRTHGVPHGTPCQPTPSDSRGSHAGASAPPTGKADAGPDYRAGKEGEP